MKAVYPPPEDVARLSGKPRTVSELIEEARREMRSGEHRRCPKCESPLIHCRLNGYICPRGCQR